MTVRNILVKGDPINNEAAADGAITPGHLVTVQADETLIVSAANGAFAAPHFARENLVVGGHVDDAYADGENVIYMANRPADWVNAWLASGEDVAVGAELAAGTGGHLVAATAGDYIVAIAREAVDASASGTNANTRILVEVVAGYITAGA